MLNEKSKKVETKLVFEEKVTKDAVEFIAKVKAISKQLGIDPNWLMLCMNIETAGTFDPKIENKMSHATGLIQFMPSTARGLRTSIEELRTMTNVQQLDFVLKFLAPHTNKMKSYVDVYLSIFYPVAVGKPDAYQLGLTPDMRAKIALQNPAYDQNKDHIVTKGEVKAAIAKFIPKEQSNLFK